MLCLHVSLSLAQGKVDTELKMIKSHAIKYMTFYVAHIQRIHLHVKPFSSKLRTPLGSRAAPALLNFIYYV